MQRKNPELIRKIAEVLKALRRAKGVTQETVYRETGIHIARIENGSVHPAVTTIFELCQYFEIATSKFFLLVERIQ